MYSYVNSLFICLDSIYVTCAENIDKATEVISKKTYPYNMPINNINHIYIMLIGKIIVFVSSVHVIVASK